MEIIRHCPECSGKWVDGQTCADYFHLMGGWELEYLLFDMHHLMVLSYHLQHPSLYSPEGLTGAKQLLVQFLDEGLTPQDVREQNRKGLDSGTRNYKITGTPDAYGAYAHPIQWTITAADVITGGMDNFYANVEAWVESILKALRDTDNL